MNTQVLMEQMLGQQFADNPQLQAMMAMMQQQNSHAQAVREEEETQIKKLQDALRQSHAVIQRLRARVDELEVELEAADRFEDEIALALGACPACWGADTTCRSCRGRGLPGFMVPDEGLFQQFVQPILLRHPGLVSPH